MSIEEKLSPQDKSLLILECHVGSENLILKNSENEINFRNNIIKNNMTHSIKKYYDVIKNVNNTKVWKYSIVDNFSSRYTDSLFSNAVLCVNFKNNVIVPNIDTWRKLIDKVELIVHDQSLGEICYDNWESAMNLYNLKICNFKGELCIPIPFGIMYNNELLISNCDKKPFEIICTFKDEIMMNKISHMKLRLTHSIICYDKPKTSNMMIDKFTGIIVPLWQKNNDYLLNDEMYINNGFRLDFAHIVTHVYIYFKNNDGSFNKNKLFNSVKLVFNQPDNNVYDLYNGDYISVCYDSQTLNENNGYVLTLSSKSPINSHIEGINFSRFDNIRLLFDFINPDELKNITMSIFSLYANRLMIKKGIYGLSFTH